MSVTNLHIHWLQINHVVSLRPAASTYWILEASNQQHEKKLWVSLQAVDNIHTHTQKAHIQWQNKPVEIWVDNSNQPNVITNYNHNSAN